MSQEIDPAPSSNSYLRGLRGALTGMKAALGDSEVGRAYLKVAAAIFTLSVIIDIGAVWAVVANTTPAADAGRWMVIALFVARVVGIMVSILIGPLIAVFVVNIAFPVFNQGVFLAGMKAVDPERAEALGRLPGMSLPRSAAVASVRLAVFLGLSLCLLLVSLIPVVGTIVATLAQAYLTARTLAWELMDPYFDVLDIRYAEQRSFVRSHRESLVGFGLPVALMMAIPIVGPLGFGLAQAAAGRFISTEVPVDPREAAGP